MRCLRSLARFAAVAAASLLADAHASAQLLVVAPPLDPPAVSRAELAYAEGDGLPATWLSLRVERGPIAVVAALPSDARVDAGLDAWLTSLEATASPNVLMPALATNCGKTDSFVHVAWPRGPIAEATQLTLETAADVASALEEYALPTPEGVPEAPRYVVWIWPAATGARTTRTLRVLGGASPLGLLPGPAFPLFVTSITRGAMALPTEASNQQLSVTFTAGEHPTSDYGERLRDWLAQRSEPLLEARARGPLFDWALYADTVPLRSLVFAYASRAAGELGSIDADDCARQLLQLRARGAPAAAACGDATDAELALGAAGPELPTLQRFVVAGSVGFAPAEVVPGGEANPPLLRAQRLDDSACPTRSSLPVPVSGMGQSGAGVSGSNGTTTVVVEETVVVDEQPPAEIGCGQSAPPPDESYQGGDGCSSSPSSSSESTSDDVDCAGDTTTSSDGDDSGCSSDTSTTSSDGDDSGCSSDTSTTSSDGDDSGCSSDTSTTSSDGDSSAYDGDTCTGAAAPGARRAEKAQASLSASSGQRRPARFRTSLWAVAFVALVLPIRRRKRGRRGGH